MKPGVNPRNPNAWIKIISNYFVLSGFIAENNTFWKKSYDGL